MADKMIFREIAAMSMPAQQPHARGQIARLHAHGVCAGPKRLRKFRVLPCDAAVDEADHDAAVAAFDGMRFVQTDHRAGVLPARLAARRRSQAAGGFHRHHRQIVGARTFDRRDLRECVAQQADRRAGGNPQQQRARHAGGVLDRVIALVRPSQHPAVGHRAEGANDPEAVGK